MMFMPMSTWAGDGSEDPEGSSIDIGGSYIYRFLENKGQLVDSSVRYYAHMGVGGAAFLDGAVVISIVGSDDRTDSVDPLSSCTKGIQPSRIREALESEVSGCSVKFTFEGTNQRTPVGTGALPGVFNFIKGSEAAGWVQGVTAFSEVSYRNLYDGIDLVYSSEEGRLKYEFRVRPGADPDAISVQVEGHDHLAIEGGDLVVTTSEGDIVDGGLRVFHAGSPDDEMAATFQLRGGDRYGFSIPGRDPDRELIIDPIIYSTYLGSTEDEEVGGCVVDSEGHAYIAGYTESKYYPLTPGVWDSTLDGWYDAFVTKMGVDGSTLEFSTLLGGDNFDQATCLVIDEIGDVYIAGDTFSRDFPTTTDCLQDTQLGGTEGFVTKLNRTGRTLEFSTYLGSPLEDFLKGITVDAFGNAYIVGNTNSFDFAVTADAYQKNKTMDNDSYEGVVCKLDPFGSKLLYSTYIGGHGVDSPYSIQVNDVGEFYVAGQTRASSFPTTNGAYITDMVGQEQIGFVTKFKSDGSDLIYSTFIGGSGEDMIRSLAVDTNGNATLVGYTGSSNYPVTQGVVQRVHGGSMWDGFVSMLSSDGSSLVYSTFLGGRSIDEVNDIHIDDKGRFHIAGSTMSSNFQVTADAIQNRLNGIGDGIVSILSADMSRLEYSTYLGGEDVDYGMGVGLQNSDIVVFAGITYSVEFPTTHGAYQTLHGGGFDAFVTKLNLDTIHPRADAGPDMVVDQHETVWFNGSNSSDNLGVANWSWAFMYQSTDIDLFGSEVSFTFDDVGHYTVTLTVLDISFLNGTDTMNVTVRDITPPIANAGLDRSINQHETLVFDCLDSTDNVGVINWTWTFIYEGEAVTLNGPGPEFIFNEAGEFNVTLEVNDAAGLTGTDWMMVHVMDITSPVAEAGTGVYVDQHETATLDGSGSRDNVDVVNWTWTFTYQEVSLTLHGEVVTFTFDESGEYTVTLSVQDAAGNRAMDTVTVHILDLTPPVADAGDDVEIDQGTMVYFNADGSSDNGRIDTYSWSFEYNGVPISLKGATPQYRFEIAEEYEVTLIVTDEEGNVGTDIITVTVKDIEAPLADAGERILVDQGSQATLDGSGSTDNVAVISWVWTFVSGEEDQELEGETVPWLFDLAGRVDVTLTVQDAAGNNATDDLVVIVRDIESPVADPGVNGEVEQGDKVKLDGAASSDNVGILLYRWEFTYKGTDITLNGVATSYVFSIPGTYQVNLTVTDFEGNTGSAVFDLKVRDTVAPVPAVEFEREVKKGEKCTLDASRSTDNVGVEKFTWTFKEGGKTVTHEGAIVDHVFDRSGDYEVTLTVEDADGNTAEHVFTVTVKSNTWLYAAIAIAIIVVLMVALLFHRKRGVLHAAGVRGRGDG
jgi:PKD repeat protein